MKRAENFQKELSSILKDKISEHELQDFADGLRSIQQIIFDSPKLKAMVNFKKLRESVICTYKAELRGEMKVLLGNKLIKAPRILGSSSIYRLIPQIWNELNSGIVRPEFQHPSIPGKQREFTINEVADFAGVSRRQVDYDKEVGKLPVEKIKNRVYVLRKNLLKYLNEKKKNKR